MPSQRSTRPAWEASKCSMVSSVSVKIFFAELVPRRGHFVFAGLHCCFGGIGIIGCASFACAGRTGAGGGSICGSVLPALRGQCSGVFCCGSRTVSCAEVPEKSSDITSVCGACTVHAAHTCTHWSSILGCRVSLPARGAVPPNSKPHPPALCKGYGLRVPRQGDV